MSADLPKKTSAWKQWLLVLVLVVPAWLGMRLLFDFFNAKLDQPQAAYQPPADVTQGLLPYRETEDGFVSPPVATETVPVTQAAVKLPRKPTASPLKLASSRLLVHTLAGDILLALYPDVAPETVKQFIQWARLGVFDGTHFSRVEPGFVLQTSLAMDRLASFTPEQKQSLRKLPGEFSKTLKHRRGVISMGREDGQPDSAETSYSILLGNAPHLDGKYTIFGEVEAGMEVVDRLVDVGKVEGTNQPGCRLAILSVQVVMEDELASLELEPVASPDMVREGVLPRRGVTAAATTILKTHCWKCHGGESVKGGLDLTSKASFYSGGEHGPLFNQTHIDKSELLRRLDAPGEEKMPPKGRALETYERMILASWLAQGADFPPPYALRKQHAPTRDTKALIAGHWAYQPIKPVIVPSVKNKNWVQNNVDAFILAKLEEKQLAPVPSASSHSFSRRLSYTLTGLPNAVTGTAESKAAQIERLLNSPHFGEQQARHWLDVVRFAESDGYENDRNRPNAFPYRDFVINAFNDDMPFDQFLRWQIAGDELAPQNPQSVAATGYLAAGPFQTFSPRKKDRFDELDDIVSTTGVAFMGLTIGCARCHDHKQDPISQYDYYRLISVFHGSERTEDYLDLARGKLHQQRREPVELLIKELQTLAEPYRQKVKHQRIDGFPISFDEKAALKQPYDAKNAVQAGLLRRYEAELEVTMDDARAACNQSDGEHWDTLTEKIKQLEQELPLAPERGLIYRGSQIIFGPFLDRGDVERERGLVPPAFLTAVTAGQPVWQKDTWKAWGHTPRAALATWLTDIDSGAGQLVARVIVNRLWQHHFGIGLVKTSNDFGISGEKPSHPELLDWLAQELITNGWKLKHIHRLIVQSRTYQLSTMPSPALNQADPDNRLYGRQNRVRLSAEEVRDSILVASGNLNDKLGGPSIKPAIPTEAIFQTAPKHGEVWPPGAPEEPVNWRRSLYIYRKRSNPVPFLQLFDAPDAAGSCGCRVQTTSPTQALALLNNPFVRLQARMLAEKLAQSAGVTPEQMLRNAYFHILHREPSTVETYRGLQFLQQDSDLNRNLQDFCHVLMMTNEFLYLD